MSESRLPFLLPWVRIALLIRSIRTTTWDDTTWPTVKVMLARDSICGGRSIERAVGTKLLGESRCLLRDAIRWPRLKRTLRQREPTRKPVITTLLRALLVLLGALLSASAAVFLLTQ